MKKVFIYAFAALLMGGFVASCSDDDPEIEIPEKPEPKPEPEPEPEPVVCPVKKTTYAGPEALKLTYSGEALMGKQVVFTPNEEDGTKATLVLSGVVPETKANPLNLPSSGIIPGEATTTLNLNLKIEGENVSFEGEDTKDGRVIAYKGSASNAALTLDLKVTMPESVLSNKSFAPVPFVKESKKDSIKGQSCITLEWLSKGKVPFFEDPNYEFNNFLVLAQMMELIPVSPKKKVVIGEALPMILNKVSFLADGNIQAEYKDSIAEAAWKTSPLHMASYKVEGANKLRVFINVDQILAFEASKGSRAGMPDLITALLGTASQLLVEGVVVTFEEKDGQMQFYLDKETMLPILNVLVPFLKDEAFLKEITGLLKKVLGPDMAILVDMLALPIIQAMPGVIEGTTSMHFGLNMAAAN